MGILHPLLGCFVCILHFCTSFEPVYQCFGDLMPTADSLEKSLMLGKTEGRGEEHVRGWDGWTASLMQWTWTWGIFRRWWGTARPGALQSVGPQSWMTEPDGDNNNQCYFLPPLWDHFSSATSPLSVARICSMLTSALHSQLEHY